MKKRRYLLVFLLVFMTVLTSLFSAVASAANYDVEYDDNKKYKYDGGYDSGEVAKKLEDVGTSDGTFFFDRGAAIRKDCKEKVLTFFVNTKNSDAINYESGLEKTQTNQYYEYEYNISVIRKNQNNTYGSEVVSWLINFSTKTKKYTISNLIEAKSNYSSDIIINATYQDGVPVDTTITPLVYFKQDDKYTTRLNLDVANSVYDEYAVVFSYKKIKYTITPKFKFKAPWKSGIAKFWTIENEVSTAVEDKSLIKSDERSYDFVLKKAIEAGEIKVENQKDDIKEDIQNIVNGEEKTVKVEYLKNIPNTPFAEKVRQDVKLKVQANTTALSPEAVAAALNVPSVNCMLSQCKSFNLNAVGNTFVADYAKSVWLSAKTVDGNNLNYFLDPNLSYEEYFLKLTNDGVINTQLYEYIFYTRIVGTYPQLSGLSPADVYGYFGYIVIPETFTYNQAFAEMFGSQPSFDGVVKSFEYKHSLTLAAYNKLLKDYDYSWLERVWNNIWGALTQCEANHYIIFADATKSDSFINENGGTSVNDTDALLKNKFQNVVEIVKNYDFKFDEKSGTILFIVLVGAGLYIYFKFYAVKTIFGGKKTKKRSKRKK